MFALHTGCDVSLQEGEKGTTTVPGKPFLPFHTLLSDAAKVHYLCWKDFSRTLENKKSNRSFSPSLATLESSSHKKYRKQPKSTVQTLFLPKTGNWAWEELGLIDVSTEELNISIINSTSRSRCQTTPSQNTKPQVFPAISFQPAGPLPLRCEASELIGINSLLPTAQLGLFERKHMLRLFLW